MFKTLKKNKNININKRFSKKYKSKRFSKKGGFWWYFKKKTQPSDNCDDLKVQISKLEKDNIELRAKIKQIANLNQIEKNATNINKANTNRVPNLPTNGEELQKIKNQGVFSGDLEEIMNTNYENK